MRKIGAEMIWFIVLLALVVIMGVLLIGGDILFYLAPRMVFVVWFGFAVLAALSIYQLWHISKCLTDTHPVKKGGLGILMFLIPIILILTVAPNESTSGTLPNQNVKVLNMASEGLPDTAKTSEAVAVATPEITESDDAIQSEEPDATSSVQADETADDEEQIAQAVNTIEAAKALPCALEKGTVNFDATADSFSKYLNYSLENMVGQTVTLYGFVYFDDSFPEHTILVSRLYISCCAADASVVGFHVKLEDAADFKDNEWICVTGTVQAFSMDYNGEYYDFPILTDGKIIRCKEPDAQEAYIYP